MKSCNVAVVGVGVVGQEMLRVLAERSFPVDKLSVFARSPRKIEVDGKEYAVEAISADGFEDVDIALFAGTEGEKGAAVTYAEEAVKRGAVVIDNGADFRMKEDVPLVVPEVNPEDVKKHKGIIANPNCSTIEMVVALYPVYKAAGLSKVVVTTFQAASGAGRAAVEELKDFSKEILNNNDYNKLSPKALSKVLAFNVIPQIGGFAEDEYTSEEWKMVKETHKIFHNDTIAITATTVRVPVVNSHSEAIYFETEKDISVEEIKNLFKDAKGLVLCDDYPVPAEVSGKDEVFVGRIRKVPSVKNAFWMWIVADNLRKGAALNAVQIAELVCKKN